MKIALVVLWAILGICNLGSQRISKLSYACVWVPLMTYLIKEAIGV